MPQPQRPDVLTALDWAARVEARSRLLLSWPRQRDVRYGDRVAVRTDLRDTELPERLFPHTPGRTLLDLAIRPGRSRSSADVTVLGVMRAKHLRSRSFYLSGFRQRRGPLTLAVHERAPGNAGAPLLVGAQVAREAHGRIGLEVPQVLDLGGLQEPRGTGAVDWVLEEVVDGAPIPPDEAAEAVPQLLAGVAELWELREVSHTPLPAKTAAGAARALQRLDELGPDLELWPEDVDRPRLVRRALSVLEDRPVLTYGLTHGDPGFGNALRLPDGRVALLDWEHAQERHLCHDAMKVLAAPGIDPATWPDRMPSLPGISGAPATSQLAVATLLFLGGWESRTRRAAARGAQVADRQRVGRLLRAVQALLDD